MLRLLGPPGFNEKSKVPEFFEIAFLTKCNLQKPVFEIFRFPNIAIFEFLESSADFKIESLRGSNLSF